MIWPDEARDGASRRRRSGSDWGLRRLALRGAPANTSLPRANGHRPPELFRALPAQTHRRCRAQPPGRTGELMLPRDHVALAAPILLAGAHLQLRRGRR